MKEAKQTGKRTVRRGSIIVHISPIEHRGKKRFELCWYEGKKRRRTSRATMDEAKAKANEILTNIEAGDEDANSFTSAEKLQYEKAMHSLKGTGFTLSEAAEAFAKSFKTLGNRGTIREAVDYYLTYCPEARRSGTVAEAVAEFLEYKQAEVVHDSFRDYRVRLNELAQAFNCKLEDITEKRLRAWIESLRVKEEKRGCGKMGDFISNTTRRGYLSKIHAFYKWAKKQNYLPPTMSAAESLSQTVKARNSRIWFVPKGSASVLTVKQANDLVHGVRDDIRAYTALLLFAGLRPSECQALHWEHVDFTTGYIEVTPQVAHKVGADRFVPIEENLRQWLEPYRKDAGRISYSTSARILADEAVKQLQILPHWVNDICRHSYASYRLAVTGEKHRLAQEMGNSVDVIDKHYRRPIREEVGKDYFAIRPAC